MLCQNGCDLSDLVHNLSVVPEVISVLFPSNPRPQIPTINCIEEVFHLIRDLINVYSHCYDVYTDPLDKKIIRGRSLPLVYLILRYGVEQQSVHDCVGQGTNFYKTPNIYIYKSKLEFPIQIRPKLNVLGVICKKGSAQHGEIQTKPRNKHLLLLDERHECLDAYLSKKFQSLYRPACVSPQTAYWLPRGVYSRYHTEPCPC